MQQTDPRTQTRAGGAQLTRTAAATARATAQAAVAQQQQQQPNLSQCDQCKHAGLGCDLRSPCSKSTPPCCISAHHPAARRRSLTSPLLAPATCHQRRISCTYPRVRSTDTRKHGHGLSFSSATSAVYPPPNMSVPSLLPSSASLYSGSLSDSGASSYSSGFYAPQLHGQSDSSRSSSSLSLHSNPPGEFAVPSNNNDASPGPTPIRTGSLPEHNLLHMYPQYSTNAANPVPAGQSTDGSVPSLLPAPMSAPSTQTNFGNWNSNGSASGLPNDFQALGHTQPRPSSLVTDFMFDLPDSRPSTGNSLPSPRSLIDMSQPPIDSYGYRRGADQHSQSGTESDFSNTSSPGRGQGLVLSQSYAAQQQRSLRAPASRSGRTAASTPGQ